MRPELVGTAGESMGEVSEKVLDLVGVTVQGQQVDEITESASVSCTDGEEIDRHDVCLLIVLTAVFSSCIPSMFPSASG
jgi:hypothetical protein